MDTTGTAITAKKSNKKGKNPPKMRLEFNQKLLA